VAEKRLAARQKSLAAKTAKSGGTRAVKVQSSSVAATSTAASSPPVVAVPSASAVDALSAQGALIGRPNAIRV
jgi:hypothetical protein